MHSSHLAVGGLLQLLLVLLSPKLLLCLEKDQVRNKLEVPQLDRSGWRTIEIGQAVSEEGRNSNQHQEQQDEVEPSVAQNPQSKLKKLVEWDDDDSNFLGGATSLVLPYEDNSAGEQQQRQANKNKQPPKWQEAKRKWPRKGGKLVYHGSLTENGTSRTIDGIKLHINTYRPVVISRSLQVNGSINLDPHHHVVGRNLLTSSKSERPLKQDVLVESEPQRLNEQSTNRTSVKRSKARFSPAFSNNLLSSELGEKTMSNTDWRPLVTTGRQRRVSKNGTKRSARVSGKASANGKTLDFEWRPITGGSKRGLLADTRRDGLLAASHHQRQAHKSTIEEPFEDDGLLVMGDKTTAEATSARALKLVQDNRWTPVETTTSGQPLFLETTTTEPPTTTTTTSLTPPLITNSRRPMGVANSSDSNQLRSASDLNYIYSSSSSPQQQQPSDWMVGRAPASNSYYATYTAQPSQQQVDNQPSFPAGAIVDTVSGQTPEMIERAVVDTQQVDYSLPLATASFQPAQPPPQLPVRAPATYTYDTYYSPTRQQPPTPTPVRQVVTVAPSGQQYVRQEHHHHYYNSPQSQQQPAYGYQSPTPAPAPQPPPQQQQQLVTNVVRELQPLLISQPIQVQQPPASTPSPQIIREIIKEVPMQTNVVQLQPVQLPRIMVPSSVLREQQPQQDSGGYYPGQRIIRQLSSSMPSMGVRQVRLPLPTIQLPMPIRLASGQANQNQAPVTRQTGSFIIPPMPQKTTTYLTETQAMPTHTTIMHTTQFTPATKTIVYQTDHQPPPPPSPQTLAASTGYKSRRRR